MAEMDSSNYLFVKGVTDLERKRMAFSSALWFIVVGVFFVTHLALLPCWTFYKEVLPFESLKQTGNNTSTLSSGSSGMR